MKHFRKLGTQLQVDEKDQDKIQYLKSIGFKEFDPGKLAKDAVAKGNKAKAKYAKEEEKGAQ